MKSWLVKDGIIVMAYYLFFDYFADTTIFLKSLLHHTNIGQVFSSLKWGEGVSKISILQKHNGKRFGVLLASYMHIVSLREGWIFTYLTCALIQVPDSLLER